MLEVLTGFGIVGAVIALGWALGRGGGITLDAASNLSRISVTVGTPALLFSTMAHTNLARTFSPQLAAAAVTVAIMLALATTIALTRRQGVRRGIIAVLCSTYVNSGNLGIPIATYVLGDASLVAPVIFLQQLAVVPREVANGRGGPPR